MSDFLDSKFPLTTVTREWGFLRQGPLMDRDDPETVRWNLANKEKFGENYEQLADADW